MPVGCLGGGGGDGASAAAVDLSTSCVASENDEHNLDVVMTSAVLNAAEQLAFMQQTLLLQIFRQSPNTNGGRESAASSSSSTTTSSSALTSCPTCAAFGEKCCQTENGFDLFREFVEINLQCYWDASLTEALSTLR
jgi:hypothetical protein